MEKPAKRESGIARILTGNEEVLLDYFKGIFEEPIPQRLDKEKPPELVDLIRKTSSSMKDFVKDYSGEPLDIKPENVRILDRSKLTDKEKEMFEKKYKGVLGLYSPDDQTIAIFQEYEAGEKLSFAETLVHEMLHFHSSAVFQKAESKTTPSSFVLNEIMVSKDGSKTKKEIVLRPRRVGFRIYSPKKKLIYFNYLDEAVITELGVRFDHEFFPQLPALSEECQERERAIGSVPDKRKDWVREDIAWAKTIQLESGQYKTIIWSYVYNKEREDLNKLVDDLYEKNKDKFGSREEVFRIFVRAVMTDDLPPVARLVEGTYGKGSFRQLGEKTGRILVDEENV